MKMCNLDIVPDDPCANGGPLPQKYTLQQRI